ncbi:MAG: serine/threonine-protein kinase, partial [Myxococcota bacterium]|nr:serine/threonine-protein kinase [Myxococcota bacterium]
GEGGMGTVYKAQQQPIGRTVALKVLLPDLVGDSLKLKRFTNEAQILSQLRHPHTVSLIDFGQLPNNQLFIVMDYVPGGTLADLMDGGRIEQSAALRMTRQILQSLAEAHSHGVIHRDLKPANVLLDEVQGEQFVVRVADFGIAKLDPKHSGPQIIIHHVRRDGADDDTPESLRTSPGVRLGTPAYIAPEQAFAKEIDIRTDLYSVGVILFEMLTGHKPFHSNTERGLCLEHLHTSPKPVNSIDAVLAIEPEIEQLLLSLMAKDRDKRPQTARAAIRIIDHVLARIKTPSLTQTQAMPVVLPSTKPVAKTTEDHVPLVVPKSGLPSWIYALVGGLALGAILALVLFL